MTHPDNTTLAMQHDDSFVDATEPSPGTRKDYRLNLVFPAFAPRSVGLPAHK
jgi:hypothetical protein